MKYNELYPSSLENGLGLLTGLSTQAEIPWHDSGNPEDIETAFSLMYGDHSVRPAFAGLNGERQISTVKKMFAQKWTKLWNAYKEQYNILDAYIVKESGNDSKDRTHTRTTTHGHTITDAGTNTGTVDIDIENTETSVESVYAFNSPELAPTPASESRSTTRTDNTETRNLSNSNTTTHGGEDVVNNSEEESGEYSVTKTGNIGYSTPQEMLKQELELWGEPFFKQVFNDISKFILIQVY